MLPPNWNRNSTCTLLFMSVTAKAANKNTPRFYTLYLFQSHISVFGWGTVVMNFSILTLHSLKQIESWHYTQNKPIICTVSYYPKSISLLFSYKVSSKSVWLMLVHCHAAASLLFTTCLSHINYTGNAFYWAYFTKSLHVQEKKIFKAYT